MIWRKMDIIGFALLLASSSPTAILAQTAAPAYTLTVTPANPTTQDLVTLKLAGTWPDNCPPYKLKAAVAEDVIHVDMLLPGAEDGNVPVCKAVKTDWQATVAVGPFTAGTYKVYVRGVSYVQAGGYAKLGEFLVQPAGSANPNPEGGNKPGDTSSQPEPNRPVPPDGQKPGETPGADRTKDLQLGVCVVLMDTSMDPNCPLEAGQCGTIVSCSNPGHTGMILVVWHFFGRGTDDRCTDAGGAPIAFPMKSAQWIDTRKVRLAICFDECGTLAQGQGQSECILLKAEDGRTFNLVGADLLTEKIGPAGQFHFGDRVRVRGLLQVTSIRTDLANFSPQQDGDIYDAIITLNVPPQDNCEGRFVTGDRVVLLADAPPGPDGKPMTALHAGARGTVVYHNSARPELGIFVSWDGFTKGMNAGDFCPAPVPPCPPQSGWPVRCDQIRPCNEGRAACPGDQLTVDLGQGRVWLTKGPQCPGGKHTLTGYSTAGIESSGNSTVSARITPCPGIGGTWKTSVSVDTVEANKWTSIKVYVDVEGINLSNIPIGKDVLAATVTMHY